MARTPSRLLLAAVALLFVLTIFMAASADTLQLTKFFTLQRDHSVQWQADSSSAGQLRDGSLAHSDQTASAIACALDFASHGLSFRMAATAAS